MTVGELIRKLEALPPDATVEIPALIYRTEVTTAYLDGEVVIVEGGEGVKYWRYVRRGRNYPYGMYATAHAWWENPKRAWRWDGWAYEGTDWADSCPLELALFGVPECPELK